MFMLIHIQHISLILTGYDTLRLRLAYLFNVWLKCVIVRHFFCDFLVKIVGFCFVDDWVYTVSWKIKLQSFKEKGENM